MKKLLATISVSAVALLLSACGYGPGDKLQDCADCPEMVVVPAGEYFMGSPESEEWRFDDEGPIHRVKIAKPFTVGVHEVTFAEWDACVADGGCNSYRPDDEGWGRGNRPVIYVSWKDAQSYVQWLRKKTGKKYRLLSESEWEYVARAGTTTPFHTGNAILEDQANYDLLFILRRNAIWAGQADYYDNIGKTAPVGSYVPNAFGLYDVHGNVWEWVEDCWNDNYEGVPSDGSAWESGECSRRVLRGGSWSAEPRFLRSASRFEFNTGERKSDVGFRLARTL